MLNIYDSICKDSFPHPSWFSKNVSERKCNRVLRMVVSILCPRQKNDFCLVRFYFEIFNFTLLSVFFSFLNENIR